MEKMRAVICTKYEPPEVFQIGEIEIHVPRKKEFRLINPASFNKL